MIDTGLNTSARPSPGLRARSIIDACLSSSETHVMWLKQWENGGLMAFKRDFNGTVVGYNQLLTIIGINVGKTMP